MACNNFSAGLWKGELRMITKYDLKYLNEYLGQYARKLVVSPEEEPIGMYIEGAAKFLEYIEKTIEDEATDNNNWERVLKMVKNIEAINEQI